VDEMGITNSIFPGCGSSPNGEHDWTSNFTEYPIREGIGGYERCKHCAIVGPHTHQWRSRNIEITSFTTPKTKREWIIDGWDCVICDAYADNLQDIEYEALIESVINEALGER
jgi:hypothetical protein